MSKPFLIASDLAQFTGTENWYRHPLARKVLYTDGVKYVADTAGAYWLVDEIAFNQMLPKVAAEVFQVWTLTVATDSTAMLVCDDGMNQIVFSKRISFTDFPLSEIQFYFTDNVILLLSEY